MARKKSAKGKRIVKGKVEIPKRLPPRSTVLREIYFKSGNLCAFTGCRNNMVNSDGDFIGQVCHIEAAEPGGERFNKGSSNEARRSGKNLMLMCYEHHQVTNNVTKYPTEALRKMKVDHEKKFVGIVDAMAQAVTDRSQIAKLNKGDNIRGLLEAHELKDEKEYMQALALPFVLLPWNNYCF